MLYRVISIILIYSSICYFYHLFMNYFTRLTLIISIIYWSIYFLIFNYSSNYLFIYSCMHLFILLFNYPNIQRTQYTRHPVEQEIPPNHNTQQTHSNAAFYPADLISCAALFNPGPCPTP